MNAASTIALTPEPSPSALDLRGRPGRLPVDQASAITRRITLTTVIVAVLLAAGKAVVFVESGSIGVLASLVHSALDMTGAIGSFIAVRFAARQACGRYSFGRGKAEGVAAVFQTCLIVLAAVHLLEGSLMHIGHDHGVENGAFAAFVMAALAGLTLWLIIMQSWAIRATGSLAVRGDRAHYTADLLATIAVIIGLGVASVEGFAWVDPLVGVVFALWLLWAAVSVARMAWAQLMDKELPEEERSFLRGLARQDRRVQLVSKLRTRAAGPHVHIQMQVDLDDKLSLNEAHEVCLGVEMRIKEAYQAADVNVVPHPVNCDVHEPNGQNPVLS